MNAKATPLAPSSPRQVTATGVSVTHFGNGNVRIDWSKAVPDPSATAAAAAQGTGGVATGGDAGKSPVQRESRRQLRVMRLELLPPCDDDAVGDADDDCVDRMASSAAQDIERRKRKRMRRSNRDGLARAFLNIAEGGRVTHAQQRGPTSSSDMTWLVSELLEHERARKYCDIRLWPTTAGIFRARISMVLAEYQCQLGDSSPDTSGIGLGVGLGIDDSAAKVVWTSEEVEIDTGSAMIEVTGTGYYVSGSPCRSVKLNDAVYVRTSTIHSGVADAAAVQAAKDGKIETASPLASPGTPVSKKEDVLNESMWQLGVSTKKAAAAAADSQTTLGVFAAIQQTDDRTRKSGWAIDPGLNVLVLDKGTLQPIFEKTYNTYAYGRVKQGEEAFQALCDDFCGSETKGSMQKFIFRRDDIFIVTTYNGFEITRKMVDGNPLYTGPHAIPLSPTSERTPSDRALSCSPPDEGMTSPATPTSPTNLTKHEDSPQDPGGAAAAVSPADDDDTDMKSPDIAADGTDATPAAADAGALSPHSSHGDAFDDTPLLSAERRALDQIETPALFSGIFAKIGLQREERHIFDEKCSLESRSDGKGCHPMTLVSFGHKEPCASLDFPIFNSKKVSFQRVITCYDSERGIWVPFFRGANGEAEMSYWDPLGKRKFANLLPVLRSFPRIHKKYPKVKISVKGLVRAAMSSLMEEEEHRQRRGEGSEMEWRSFESLLALHALLAYLYRLDDRDVSAVLVEEGTIEWINDRICKILPENFEGTTLPLHLAQEEELKAAAASLQHATLGALVGEALRRGCGESMLRLVRWGYTADILDPLLMAVDADIGLFDIRIAMPMKDSSFVPAILCGEAGDPCRGAGPAGPSSHFLWIEDVGLPDPKNEVQLLSLEKFKENSVRQNTAVIIRPKGLDSKERLKTAVGIAQQASRLAWQAGLSGARAVVLLWPEEWGVHLVSNPNFLTPHSTASRPLVSFLILPAKALPEASDLQPGFTEQTYLEFCQGEKGGFASQVLRRCGDALVQQILSYEGPADFSSRRKTSSSGNLRGETSSSVQPPDRSLRSQSVITTSLTQQGEGTPSGHSPGIVGSPRDAGEDASAGCALSQFRTMAAAKRVVTLLGGLDKVHRDLRCDASDTPETKPIRILSLDGGGVRGLASIEILDALCNVCNSSVRDLFDFVIGTSTGGLIAVSTALANFSLEKTRKMYLDSAENIFKEDAWSSLLINGPGFSAANNLEGVIDKFLGDKSTRPMIEFNGGNIPNVCLVSTLISRAPSMHYAFRNYRLPSPGMVLREGDVNGCHNARIRDALRASSAAPYYLYELNLRKDLTTGRYMSGVSGAAAGDGGQQRADSSPSPSLVTPRHVAPCSNLTFIDGGITANNPTAIAIHEVRQLFGNDAPLAIVSIGTGRVTPHEYTFGTTRSTRFPSWIQNMFFATGDVDSTDAAVKHTLGPNDVYERFHPVDDIFGCSIDDVRPETLEQVVRGAKEYIQGHMERFVGLKQHLMRDDENGRQKQ